eukprot:scaffold1472_cov157-Skeletonema_menzelii.AAC.4
MKIPAEAIGAIVAASVSVSRRLLAGDILSAAGIASVSTKRTSKKPVIPRHLQEQLAEPDATQTQQHRHLGVGGADTNDYKCDTAFIKCVINSECRSCFNGMEENDIDWTNVVPDTPCQDVLGFLHVAGHCTDLRGVGNENVETFCGAFDSCVMWEDDDEEEIWDEEHPDDNEFMDCSKLTECKWEGMHDQFLGDGICHDTMPGCYNSAVCGFDGGDCCKDTCEYPGSDSYGECGMEGYACRDPKSTNCQPVLARMYNEVCETETNQDVDFDDDMYEKPEKENLPQCGVGEMLYRLIQYDSWGDGWDETQMTLRNRADESKDIYKGGLEYGSQGTVHLCLTKNEPKCYHVSVLNGIWGNEISWELRPINGGAPVIAAGGSPTDCTVPLGGLIPDCPNTCDKSRPDTDITDPNYKSYKDMEACIEKSCVIQVGACSKKESCSECMQETTPDFCFADADFNSLIDCSMCSCTEKRPDYCDAKSTGEAAWNGSSAASHQGNVKVKPAPDASGSGSGSAMGKGAACTPDQTLKGTTALDKFDKCVDIGKMITMLTEFDNENFGKLDIFEACAKTFANDKMHGGKHAMDCMRILHDIARDDVGKDNNGGSLPESVAIAVAEMGHELYYNGQDFCDCVVEVNEIAPMCNSFTGFKTLLYEAIDACKSLDMIDCAALDEFYSDCKSNLSRQFANPGFEDKDSTEQCEFVSGGCGESGAFPSLRKMDCGVGKEVSKSVWDFYKIFNRECWDEIIKDNPGADSSDSIPSPTPVAPRPSPSIPSPRVQPTPKKPYMPWKPSASEEKKKYYSPSDPEPEPDTEKAYAGTKSHHYILYPVFILGFLTSGYVWYKKRKENFNYMRFRQMRAARNFGGDGDYMGVSMADSTSFEPATLPPRPDGLA